ncbi:MAG: MerR family transcriptional regulator, partial [Mesorhizobium sp.]
MFTVSEINPQNPRSGDMAKKASNFRNGAAAKAKPAPRGVV